MAASVRFSAEGSKAAIAALSRAIENGPAHAYLFTGQEGLGKGMVALEFAAALNCAAETRPCRECRSCRDALSLRHPDVEVIQPGGICDDSEHRDHSESRDLRICQVRRLERVLALAPYVGAWRVAILEQADSLTIEAANAFLKTLEEPPPNTVLLLLSDREEELPETILSRCRRISFATADRETVCRALIERGAARADADRIAALAAGRIGWAIRALQDETLLSRRDRYLDEAVSVAHGSRSERFTWASRAADRDLSIRKDYGNQLDTWQTWWRDVLAVQAGGAQRVVNADRRATVEEESKLYTAPEIVSFLKALAVVRGHLDQNVDPQLALENLMLDLPRPRAAGAVGSRH
jgi:DNA polymerase III subunit delta'